MSLLSVILLGIIQGFTEFLPVSSSGHLIVTSWLMSGEPLPMSLNVAFHLGTTLAVLFYFRRDWWTLASGSTLYLLKKKPEARTTYMLLIKLIIASIPAGIIGLLFKNQIEKWLHHPLVVIVPLATVGILLWMVDRKFPKNRTETTLTLREAFLIGVAQACALIPGVSRSGATILAARALQLDRISATRFSFLLGTPAMIGATALHYRELGIILTDPNVIIGVATSAIAGCLAISWLLKFLEHFGFLAFAVYRCGLAFTILIFYFLA